MRRMFITLVASVACIQYIAKESVERLEEREDIFRERERRRIGKGGGKR